MKSSVLMLLLVTAILAISIYGNSPSYQETKYGIKSTIDSIDIQIQFYSPEIVRVLKSPEGTIYDKKSLAVIKTPENIALGIRDKGNEVILSGERLQVHLDLKTGAISFCDSASNSLLKEKGNGTKFCKIDDAGNKTYSVYQSFVLGKDEAIYGLGQHQNGKMVQRNTKLDLIQDNKEDAVPFFQSSKGYGLFWDNYSTTTFLDTSEETSFNSEVGDCSDYYFMYGGSADGVIAEMRELTGQAPMFPLWTYGYWQSKERYKSQNETVGVVKKYRELSVPLDGIIQDWQYWGDNYHWNAMEFLNPQFSSPQKMIDDVHSLNAHIIISVWASFGPETKPYKELDSKNMLLDFKTWPMSGKDIWPPDMEYPSGVRVYDAYNPEARNIYWKYLNKGIFSLGVDGWWLDSTEPDHMDSKPEDFDNKTYLGSYRRVRNAFPLMTVGGVYEHQRAVTSDKRVFILTRSAFAGQQRYAANIWSGDVIASWDVLKRQISTGLNFSLCGIPYWNSDIGGFFLWNYPLNLQDAEYCELYVRWLEFGAFCPMMRSHGTDAPREISQFGDRGSKYFDSIEKFIRLRYDLLPYIYSTSWDVTANQSSMMRALVMDFSFDKDVLDINDEYMFGKSILVCPVTEPMYIKKKITGTDTTKLEDFSVIKEKDVYLPKGTEWYDFWDGQKFAGGQTVSKETPLDIIPLYIKAGSIIPIGPKVQYANEKKWDELEIRIYRGADGQFVFYEDENDNYNYEKGEYSTITFTWSNAEKSLTIGRRNGAFNGMLKERTFNIVLVSEDKEAGQLITEQYDKVVPYKGDKVIIEFN